MTPAPTATPALEQSPRLKERRNAMADVMAGMSASDINTIRVNAPASVSTGRPTCISTTDASSSAAKSSSGRRTTSNSSFSDMESDGSTASMDLEGVNGSGLAALAIRASNSPMTSPILKHRRNGVANVLATVDQESLNRIRSQALSPSRDQRVFAF